MAYLMWVDGENIVTDDTEVGDLAHLDRPFDLGSDVSPVGRLDENPAAPSR